MGGFCLVVDFPDVINTTKKIIYHDLLRVYQVLVELAGGVCVMYGASFGASCVFVVVIDSATETSRQHLFVLHVVICCFLPD